MREHIDPKIIFNFIQNNKLHIIAKPNSSKTEITDIIKETNEIKISVNAIPDNNKANIELLKFIKKITKKPCKIISGKTSRKKIIEFK